MSDFEKRQRAYKSGHRYIERPSLEVSALLQRKHGVLYTSVPEMRCSCGLPRAHCVASPAVLAYLAAIRNNGSKHKQLLLDRNTEAGFCLLFLWPLWCTVRYGLAECLLGDRKVYACDGHEALLDVLIRMALQ